METRWVQRFENYKQALSNLSETIDCIQKEGNSKIYTMALIQAFEMTFELGWKILKDYLEYSGIMVNTPRDSIKEAFKMNFINDGQGWIEMMEARNKTVHTYKEEFAKGLCNDILTNYFNMFNELSIFLEGQINE
jgi:nucleotidyltransferase substrate binding protein (TIGR01987 family)